MSTETAAKSPSLMPVAAALFVGLIAGAVFSGGDGAARKVQREATARIAAVEAAVGEQIAAATASAQGAADTAAAAATQQLAAMEAALAEARDAGAAEVAALRAEVEALTGRIEAMAAETVAAAPEPPVAEAPPPQDAAAAEPGSEARDLALTVGQTGSVGGVPVFLSRYSEETEEAWLVVVGSGPRKVGAHSGPVTLSNGCELAFGGIEGRIARIGVTCP
ncbi:MAG: hypothetical protein ACFCUS_01450 [Rubrimonas sp.]|uniref:hypothetical protein n=1 Tax=Rubrimonas sp. TaxID=2036015 RepID=UPI002FDCBD72